MPNVASAATRSGRRTAWACLACTVVVGAVVALDASAPAAQARPPAVWWWVFALALAVQLVAGGLVPAPRAVPEAVWPAALVPLALAGFLLHPGHALTAALIVVSAATVAQRATRRTALTVVAIQSAVATAGAALIGWPPTDVLAVLVVFAGFQTFGVLVVLSARSEADARAELARTHTELRATVTLLEAASRDAERLRIARDLHDLVGHQLTALAIELEVASHKVRDPDGAAHVQRARDLAKGLLRDVRTAVGEIRQRRTALEPMLTALAADVPGLRVTVQVSGAHRVDGDQAQVVLRCAQEAITNTLRHAGASRLDLRVDADEEGVRVIATDDGRGSANVVAGHGLQGMRERLEAAGGTLSVRSAVGAGFTVDGWLPVRPRTGPAGGAGPVGTVGTVGTA